MCIYEAWDKNPPWKPRLTRVTINACAQLVRGNQFRRAANGLTDWATNKLIPHRKLIKQPEVHGFGPDLHLFVQYWKGFFCLLGLIWWAQGDTSWITQAIFYGMGIFLHSPSDVISYAHSVFKIRFREEDQTDCSFMRCNERYVIFCRSTDPFCNTYVYRYTWLTLFSKNQYRI